MFPFPQRKGGKRRVTYGEKGKRNRIPGKGKRQSSKFELTAQNMEMKVKITTSLLLAVVALASFREKLEFDVHSKFVIAKDGL